MRDNVLSLKVITADGNLIKTGNRAKKSSAGYNLTHLFVGSEGTLGIIVEATLKVKKIPEAKIIAYCRFNNFTDAANSAIQTIQQDIQIGKMEFLDPVMMKAVNMAVGFHYEEMPTLIMESKNK